MYTNKEKKQYIEELLKEKEYLTTSDVAFILGTTRQNINVLKQRGKLKPIGVICNADIYSREHIQQYIRKNKDINESLADKISLSAIGVLTNDNSKLINKYIDSGKIQHIKIGNGVYVSKDDFDKFAMEVYEKDYSNFISGLQAMAILGLEDKSEFEDLIKKHNIRLRKKSNEIRRKIFYKDEIEHLKQELNLQIK